MINPYQERLPVIYLKPMEAYFIKQPAIVVTVLGSCLLITMFHSRCTLTAVCHVLLPRCDRERPSTDCPDRFKYVTCAIPEMIMRFERMGVRRGELEVKVFGGADMFTVREDRRSGTIGRKNIEAAIEVMGRERLEIAASDMGGRRGRKLYVNTGTGEVLLKRLRNTDGMDIFNVDKILRSARKP